MLRSAGLILAAAVAFVAAIGCGGGDDGDGDAEDLAAIDIAYVHGFCEASLRMNEPFLSPSPSATESTREWLARMAPVFKRYAGDLDALEPPADFADFHNRYVDEWQKLATVLASGDFTGDPFLALEEMQPSASVGARFAAIAAKDDVCIRAGITFTEDQESPTVMASPTPVSPTATPSPTPAAFAPPSVDYTNPQAFLAQGPQSTLSPASIELLEREVGSSLAGIAGIGRVHAWMAATFRTEPDGGKSIGRTEVNGIVASRLFTGCHDWALLMTSVLRHYGYPALMVDTAGLQWAADFAAGRTTSAIGHVFVEVFVDNAWILVDCTSGNYIAAYDPANPAIAYTGAGDAIGFYAIYKGIDPATYGVSGLPDRMRAFAAALPRLAITPPAYTWQPLPR